MSSHILPPSLFWDNWMKRHPVHRDSLWSNWFKLKNQDNKDIAETLDGVPILDHWAKHDYRPDDPLWMFWMKMNEDPEPPLKWGPFWKKRNHTPAKKIKANL